MPSDPGPRSASAGEHGSAQSAPPAGLNRGLLIVAGLVVLVLAGALLLSNWLYWSGERLGSSGVDGATSVEPRPAGEQPASAPEER